MRLVLAKITDSIHETFVLCCQSISPSLPSSFWVPFCASHSHWRTPPTLNMFVLLLLLCIKPDWQFFFFHISISSVFHALFHMLYFHALFHISSVFHALFPCFISHFLSFPCFVSHMMDLLWILFQLLQHLLYTVKMKSSPETAFSISKHSILTHSPLKINWKM